MKTDFISRLIQTAEKHPDHIAIEERNGRCITYQTLLGEANRIFMPETATTIAIQFPRSVEFVIALTAIWLRNKTALILDPDWPENRTHHILKANDSLYLLGKSDITLAPATNNLIEPRAISKGDPAYSIYTSGSTGKPKGTLVSHDGLVPLLDAQIKAFQLTRHSRSFWMHGVAFDASLSDIGTILLAGGTLCIDQELDINQLFRTWAQMAITYVDLPPALLPLLNSDNAPESLATITIGGQVACAESIRKWSKTHRVINVYGPTEATICTSLIQCDQKWQTPWIGEPLPGIEYQVCSDTGELTIIGEAVALEYKNEPELTRSKFSSVAGKRSFHTGDLVKQHDNGQYEFLGRLDRQFKFHGKLISPEEIETLVRKTNECYVFKTKAEQIAIFVAGDKEVKPKIIDLLKQHLSNWMIPTLWQFCERLPQSKSGKPDTKQMESQFSGTRPVKNQNAATIDIFRLALNKADIDPDTSFFDLGGDSLAVLRLICLANENGQTITPETLAQHPSANQLDKVISSQTIKRSAKSTIEIKNRLAPLIRGNALAAKPTVPNQILITGATGFYGSALLGELLTQQPNLKIICLVRGGDPARVTRALANHGFKRTPAFQCLAGNLDSPIPTSISRKLDCIIHVAADVAMTKTFDELWQPNVIGTANMAALLSTGLPKSFHHISTLSVFVDAVPLPAECLETDHLNQTEEVYGGYAQSKWAAEKLVRESIDKDALSVYRLGLIAANTKTGYQPPYDWFTQFIHSHKFDLEDFDHQTCDYTPVNIAAGKNAKLILSGQSGTYHIANPEPMCYAKLRLMAKNETKGRNTSLTTKTDLSPFRVFKTTNTKLSTTQTELTLSKL